MEFNLNKSKFASTPKSPIQEGRPRSMNIMNAHTVIPAHILAEAISKLHGNGLRWSGPVTPNEVQYVQRYVLAKYPEYSNSLIEGKDKADLYNICIKEDLSQASLRKSIREGSTPLFGSNFMDSDKTQLEPSKLHDILTKKSSSHSNFISIPEIQAQNKVLKHCGLQDEDYLVLFTPCYKDAMVLVGESYPFFRENFYLSIIPEENDGIRAFANFKESKVIVAPENWLDLRIKGSQLSQYFRRRCRHSPKGLFSYPVDVNGRRYSIHWVSEARRFSWHVLVDATDIVVGDGQLNLSLHMPDFVLCSLDNNTNASPSKITCLLVRRKSFDTMPVSL